MVKAGYGKTEKPVRAVAFTALMLGVVSQVGQVLLLRELLMVFQGNELSLGLILAAWLAWVGVGSWLGATLAKRTPRPLFLIALVSLGLLPALPVTILIMRGLRGFFYILPGAYLNLTDMVVSCFILMAPVCLLLGLQFVLLSRVWRENERVQDASGAGKTYVSEAAGNMLGGLLFTFLLVRYLNSLQAAVLSGLLMPVAVLFLARKTGVAQFPTWFRRLLPVLFLTAVLSFPLLEQVDQWAYRLQWQHFTPQHRLVTVRHSRHGAIAVVERQGQYTFFQSGHLVFSTAGPDDTAPELEEQEAVALAHLSMVQHGQPKRVLLIGGGLRGVLGEIVKYPVDRVDYIELDEVLTKTAKRFVSPLTQEALADPRVRLVHTDGRLFIKAARGKYDIIIVDVPDPVTAVLNRFYTREFFREAAARLNPGGVFVIGAVSTPDLRGTAIANRNATVYHTLRSVFPRVLLAGGRFMYYFADDGSGQITLDAAVLQERYQSYRPMAGGFPPEYYHSLLQESQLRRVNWVIRNHGRSGNAYLAGPEPGPLSPGSLDEQELAEKQLPSVEQRYFINSDFRPIGYYYTLMFWEELTRPGHGRTLSRLLAVKPWWILPFCFVPLFTVTVLGVNAGRGGEKRAKSFAVLFAVFTTGLSTMALQIALLFSFQSTYGFVYETVGLIVAMFMCGLALGAFYTQRYIKDKASLHILAEVQLLIAVLAVLIAALLPQAASVRFPALVFVFFSLLTFASGLINGVDFPLAVACYLDLNRKADRATGTVYGVELFGACAGATLASALVAPVFGIITCCLLAALANGTAFTVLLLSGRNELW